MDKDLAEKLAALRGGSVKNYNTQLGAGAVTSTAGQSRASISNLVASSIDPALTDISAQSPKTVSSFLHDDLEVDIDFLSPSHFDAQQRTLFSAYGFVCQEYKSTYDELLKKGSPVQSDLDDLLGWALEVEERYVDYYLLADSQNFNDAGWSINALLKKLQQVEFGTEEYDEIYRQLRSQKKILLQANALRLERAKNQQLFADTPISRDLKGKPLSELMAKVYKHCLPVIAEYEKKLQEDDIADLELLSDELSGVDSYPYIFLEVK